MLKILIVEDEKPISDLIKLCLKKAGYSCFCAYDGNTAADMINTTVFDLILLDIMLPNINGFELLEFITPLNIPVIFLTAKDSVSDKVKGLRMGAEDYIVKPFEVAELLARVDVVLRRFGKNKKVLMIKDLEIHPISRTVKRKGQEIALTPKEFDLLLFFAQNPNTALYRETIYERVWEKEFSYGSKTVDLHIQRLRKKTGLEDELKAVNKIGYKLEASL